MVNNFKFVGVHKLLLKKANNPHPYGLGDPNHVLAGGYHATSLQQNTPEWDDQDSTLKNRLGNKFGLNEIASAYHIPGMPKQQLFVKNGLGTHIGYRGSHHGEDSKEFRVSADHLLDSDYKHRVHWDYLGNATGDHGALKRFIGQAAPIYKKAGVQSIDTTAYGESKGMNGQHTWSTLGFDFADPRHRESTRRNALAMTAHNPELQAKAQSATHPFHFQEIARLLANDKLPNDPVYGHLNAKQHFNKMLKNAYSEDDNPNFGAYEARLNMDPEDAGYQRFKQLFPH